MMEKDVILPKLNTYIAFYVRYVDDVFCILDKNKVDDLLMEMNSFDTNLKFTVENANPMLAFLDTEIYLDHNNVLQHKYFKKPISSTVLQNYNNAIVPFKYLNSTLCGEIHRHNNTNSHEHNLNLSLNELKLQFINNAYPEKLINQKIEDIKNRQFTSKYINVLENVDHSAKFTISLPFTSKRCSQIERKLVRVIKTITPEYYLCFAWTLIKIGQVVTPRLKPRPTSKFESTGCCYIFTCDCDQQYVGETSRRLKSRVSEHGRKSSNSGISNHIWSCDKYLHNRSNFITENNFSQCKGRFNYLLDHFDTLTSNLNFFDLVCYESIAIKKYRPTLNLKTDTVKPLKLF